MKKELTPIYDTRKSFYQKAFVCEDEYEIKLFSYRTYIATVHDGKIEFSTNIENLLSQTTLRHLKEFMKQYLYKGDKAISKKDILKMSRN